jgi:hypothetical protein
MHLVNCLVYFFLNSIWEILTNFFSENSDLLYIRKPDLHKNICRLLCVSHKLAYFVGIRDKKLSMIYFSSQF